MTLTQEQVAIRSRGVSGSEIAAVCGLSPWASPWDIYLSKIGDAPPFEESIHTRRGQAMGPVIARLWAEEKGKTISRVGRYEETLVHPQYPIVRATPDGRVHSGETTNSAVVAALECKSPARGDGWGEEGSDEIPEHYIPQVQWECSVLGVDRAYVVPLIYGVPKTYEVLYSETLFHALRERAEQFWRDFVEPRRPPPVDASDAAREWLLRNHSGVKATIEASVEQETILRSMASVKARREACEREEAEIKARLLAGMQAGTTLKGAYGRATIVEVKSKEVPEKVVAAHTKPGYKFLRITTKGEEA